MVKRTDVHSNNSCYTDSDNLRHNFSKTHNSPPTQGDRKYLQWFDPKLKRIEKKI
jgi:hypothetical protein